MLLQDVSVRALAAAFCLIEVSEQFSKAAPHRTHCSSPVWMIIEASSLLCRKRPLTHQAKLLNCALSHRHASDIQEQSLIQFLKKPKLQTHATLFSAGDKPSENEAGNHRQQCYLIGIKVRLTQNQPGCYCLPTPESEFALFPSSDLG